MTEPEYRYFIGHSKRPGNMHPPMQLCDSRKDQVDRLFDLGITVPGPSGYCTMEDGTIVAWERVEHHDVVCSRCGILEGDTEYGRLIDIRVVCQEGEEGFCDITQLLCDICMEAIRINLMELGFVSHHHGSTDLLDGEGFDGKRYCVPNPYKKCPIPGPHGRQYIGNAWMNDPDWMQEDPTADWWCEHCQTDDHPTDSTLCKHLTPEQRASIDRRIADGTISRRDRTKYGFPRSEG